MKSESGTCSGSNGLSVEVLDMDIGSAQPCVEACADSDEGRRSVGSRTSSDGTIAPFQRDVGTGAWQLNAAPRKSRPSADVASSGSF